MELPRTPSFRLDGRTALVFGASSGIGLGAAMALAEAGARVICAARGAERLNEAVAAIRHAGCDAEALVLDIADTAAVAEAIGGLDRLDVMVNSAGVARHGPALETTPEDFDAVAMVNWRAAHFAAQAAARKMIAGGNGGSIITISSQMAHVGGIDRAVYAASKHAVEGMTKSMAIEWGPKGVRVNTICPTFVRTPLTEPTFADPARVAWIEDKIKLGRVGEIEDIMGAVVFLASDASALVTGASLLVDGGWTAG
ncbi:SDR family oxidoreductase [uncultured Hoeflea sp.]|uniref:SDR family NAD(P)-dependent oxidoreductase n=1 Tax=uncultured Hoeflea sp. TaxID=538666 RepID=UPI00261540DD|nr:SDR family oxidoreductase [uncultured Hoeflea sp.]